MLEAAPRLQVKNSCYNCPRRAGDPVHWYQKAKEILVGPQYTEIEKLLRLRGMACIPSTWLR